MKIFSKTAAIVLALALVVTGLSGCGPAIVGMIGIANQINEGSSGSGSGIIEGLLPDETTEGVTVEDDTEPAGSEDEAGSGEETTTQQTAEKSDLLPEYTHYDATEFNEKCEQLEELAKNGDAEGALKLYDELYAEAIEISDMYTLMEILSSEDVSNEYYKEEDEYMYDVMVDSIDRMDIACHKITQSDIAKDFEKHLNDDYLIDYYESYEEMTDEAKELMSEEEKLQNEYRVLMDNLNDITYKIDGKEYRFGDLLEYEDNDLYNSDQKKFYEAYYGCYEELNKQAGEIFIKLVKIRDRIAKLNGYDNYNDYADENLYGRDYSSRELEKMREAARKFGSEYQGYMYYAYYKLPELNISGDELVDESGEVLSGISPLVDKAYQYIKDNKLYSIGDEENRLEAGFTTSFIKDNIPFIYIKTSDTAYDMITFTHEFGHFTDNYWNPNPYPLYVTGSYDLFEIHSTGLQLLAGDNYSKEFGNDAKTVDAFNVLNLLSYIMDGCLYDEWQREVYKNPDMTLDEINDLFEEISGEYGVASYEGMKYSWVEVEHNFSAPLYYISYATSAFASLQIWLMSRDDYGEAVSTWENIVKAGAYDDGYMDVIKEAGLKPFNDTEAVSDVLNRTYENAQSMLF